MLQHLAELHSFVTQYREGILQKLSLVPLVEQTARVVSNADGPARANVAKAPTAVLNLAETFDMLDKNHDGKVTGQEGGKKGGGHAGMCATVSINSQASGV